MLALDPPKTNFGLERKDIEVTVEEGVLTIRGERKEERKVKEEDYYCCEW